MNKFSVYISIDGGRFAPDQFQAGLAGQLIGEVKARKRGGPFWRSEVVNPAETQVETELLNLLVKYKSEIGRAKSLGATRMTAQIVGYMSGIDNLSGYHISNDISRLLSELGMDLDIDIVRKL